MRARCRFGALVAAAVLVLGASCGDGDEDGGAGARSIAVDGERIPITQLADALEGLCQAGAGARGDVGAARATFYDRSHDDLHLLARALDAIDSAAAARLLEAKQRVESGLDAVPPPPGLPADIDRLVTTTRDGLEALSVDAPDCPEDE